MQRYTYYVRGMHCASCEVLIEKELLTLPGVRFVDASLSNKKVNIGYKKERPNTEQLSKIFAESGYIFSDRPFPKEKSHWFKSLLWAGFIIAIFILVGKLGLTSFIRVNSTSSLGAFFIFGLIAGVSSCAALIGGLVLSLSKQWLEMYDQSASLASKMTPHILFNIGRIVSYSFLGIVLGFLGEKIKFSPTITAVIVIAVSILMLILALQMLGVAEFNRFRIALPKGLTAKIYNSEKKGGWFYPALAGFITVLLPCGFTIIAEGAAVLSGSSWRGLLIMFFFVLGTMFPLMGIGLSSVKLGGNHKSSELFLKTAGLLIIFFVIFNLDVQFGIGRFLSNFANAFATSPTNNPVALIGPSNNYNPPSTNQTQLLQAIYSDKLGLSPDVFNVKVGSPVRLEIEVRDDVYGCMSTILIPGLWEEPELMRKGNNIVMEFIAREPGEFPLTCAMGVPWGTINAQL